MAVPSFQLPAGRLQPRRLLDQIEQLPKIDDDHPLRWLEGLTWAPFICKTMYADSEGLCTPNNIDDTITTPDECVAWVTQTPFRLVDAFNATTLEYTFDEVGNMLESSYNRLISAAFAKELLGGGGSFDRSLSGEATAPAELAFGAAVKVERALSALESEIALRMQGTVGYIHIPPGLLAEAVMRYGVYLVGDHWETPGGNIVISDAGYYAPPPPSGGSAATDGEDWIYASGPVFYESTAPVLFGGSSSLEGSTTELPLNRDRFTQFIAGYGILVFDTCPVTAALATYTT